MPQVRRVRNDQRDHRVRKDQRVQAELLVQTELLVLQAHKARRVRQALRDRQALMVMMVRMEQRGKVFLLVEQQVKHLRRLTE